MKKEDFDLIDFEKTTKSIQKIHLNKGLVSNFIATSREIRVTQVLYNVYCTLHYISQYIKKTSSYEHKKIKK